MLYKCQLLGALVPVLEYLVPKNNQDIMILAYTLTNENDHVCDLYTTKKELQIDLPAQLPSSIGSPLLTGINIVAHFPRSCEQLLCIS